MAGEQAPTAFSSPYLHNKVIQLIQTDLAALSWMDIAYPLARVGVNKDAEGNEFKYPQVYINNGGVDYYDVRPNKNLTSYCFFELNNPQQFDSDNQITYNLSLIVWFNLKTVSPSKSYDYTAELIKDILRMFNESDYADKISNISYTVEQEEIFSKYSMAIVETQFLMYPYSAFKITFDYTDVESENCDAF